MVNFNEIKTYLSFIIDNEYFAVNVSKVLEVLQSQKITRVPNVSNDIKGVINIRGEIIPVFEMRTRFGLPDRALDDKYVIIVLEITSKNTKSVIGAIANRVKDVITIENNDIMAVPKMNTKINVDLITGIIKLKDDFIMMLDVDKMFSEQELEVLSQMVSEKQQ
jgi:purine-binding chemotaxis protein CheW